MSKWIVRNVALSFACWAVFGFVLIGLIELLVFDRFEPLEYLGGVIGLGIGFTFAIPLRPLREADA